ncbi:MAG: hypothetical protein GC191_13630 [Azospirillum sp.]|nr:hypothetical protein [Azospirillum sp.]
MLGASPEWELPIDIVFLIVTAGIAWHGIRYRDAEGRTDFVRLLFGCIAATYFFLVLTKDILGIPLF